MTILVRYDAACRALAEARSIDEVKDIRDRAVAMQAYAPQAKNRELEADAVEIRMRAIRKLGQICRAQKATVGLAKGTRGQGRPKKGGIRNNPPKQDLPSLASQGIDKSLAHQARVLSRLSDSEFLQKVCDARGAGQRLMRDVVKR